jgi:hypothetical protein
MKTNYRVSNQVIKIASTIVPKTNVLHLFRDHLKSTFLMMCITDVEPDINDMLVDDAEMAYYGWHVTDHGTEVSVCAELKMRKRHYVSLNIRCLTFIEK